MITALLIACCEIQFAPCEKFTPAFVKQIGEKISEGYKRIAVVIDTQCVACDTNWISFCAAVVSRDGDYFRSRIPLAETRALISKYAES